MIRKCILDLLAARPGEYVSGEVISQQLKLTRAAVWKQIKALKDTGYEIEAQTKSGYRLLRSPVGLDEWAIERELTTGALGHPLCLFEEVDSTNELAKEQIRQGAGHGRVLVARRQSSGRGRLQRRWQSPDGGVWMSVILKPDLPLAEAAKLTLAAGIAVTDAVRDVTGLEVGIKWPNDIVVEGKKLAGILGEVVGEWNSIQTIILGIGINANFLSFDLEGDLPATTLQELLGYDTNLNLLTAGVLNRLEVELQRLENKGLNSLTDRWLERAVGIGQEVIVIRGEQTYLGVMQGITASGALVLKLAGEEMEFTAGEVRLRAVSGAYF